MTSTPTAPEFTDIDFTARSVFPVLMTPVLAEQYLLANTSGRAMNTKSFDRLVTDMRNGNFKYTGDALKLTVEAKLIDGLSRLNAIIKAGVSVEILIATGVPAESRNVINTGRTWRLKDALDDMGVAHATPVASALTSIQAWERGDHLADPNPFRGTTTNLTSLAFLEAHPHVEQIAIEAAKLSAKLPTLTTKQVAAFIWAFDQLDRDVRTRFFTKLVNGANTGAGDPVYQLREILIKNDNSLVKLSNRKVEALTIKAFNAFHANVDIKQLVFVGGGTAPEDFPLPK